MKKEINQELNELFISSKSFINETLISELPINVFLVDKNGYIAWGNTRMLQTLGIDSLNDFVGKHVSFWDKERWVLCEEIINSRKEQIAEESAHNKFYLTTRKPILNKEGDAIGILGVSLDITEKKQAQLAKEAFLDNMRHDIRTPFSGIYSLVEHAKNQTKEPETKELLSYAAQGAAALLALMNQVLDITKQGTYPLNKTEFNLRELLQEITALVNAKCYEKGLTLEVNCPNEAIVSDRFRLHRILLNLVSNAIKFTDKGHVAIRVTTQPTPLIQIEDTGSGIPEEQLAIIFEPFTKLTPSYRTGEFKGAGTGLYLAQTMAQEIGATLTIESIIHQGSCLTLTL